MTARDPATPKPPDPARVPAPLPAPGATRLPARPSRDVAVETGDALAHYMAQLREYAPISREQEHALAVRWVEQRDRDAARQLVLANLRLVVKIAMEYRRAWTNVLDLIQEGNVGLLQATQRFDPYKGVKLSSYAVYWIRAYILKYILDNIRLVRLGKTRAERKLFFRLNKEKRELERLGFEAEPKLLAERLDVSESDVRDMEQRLSRNDLSLQAPACPATTAARSATCSRGRESAPSRPSATPSCVGSSWSACASSRSRSSRATGGSWMPASWPRSRSRCKSSEPSSASRASGSASSRRASCRSSAST